MQGWIKLHRKVMDSAVWSDPNYLKLWMYCLFKASHKEHEILVGNQMVELQRGQFITGRKALAEELNKGVKPDKKLSEKSWSRYLKNLEKWQMLTIKVTNKYSIVTIDKYDFYQSEDAKTVQQTDPQLTSKCPTSDQQLTTNKNVKNEKNDKEKIIAEIKDLRLPYSSEIQSLIDQYWNIIKKTRKTNQISYSVICKTMQQWRKFSSVVIHYSLKKHIEAYDDGDHDEKYTLGIMRNTTPQQAEDFLNRKNFQKHKNESTSNLAEINPNNLFEM